MEVAESKLTIEILNTKPVELGDLTRLLLGISNEFKRFIDQTEPSLVAADVRLYIEEIRQGRIIADVVAISPQVMQVLPFINAVASFTKHLKNAYDYLAGNSDEKPSLDKASYQNLTSILEPIAKDSGSQLNLGQVEGNVYISINSPTANAVKEKAAQELVALGEATTGLKEKVLFYWYRARADTRIQTGDKAIVESVSLRPIKVVFANDEIKEQMIQGDDNPFRFAYVVDILIDTIGGQPKLFKVVTVHERFPLEDA